MGAGAGAGDGLEPPRFSRLPALGEEEKAFDAGLARLLTRRLGMWEPRILGGAGVWGN